MRTLKIDSYYRFDDKEYDVHFYFSGVYLHGEVEQLCHYDICFPTNPEEFDGCVRDVTTHFDSGDSTSKYLFLDGVFPCIVDDKYECTAFLWYDDKYANESCWQRGLIVLNTDKEFMDHARMKYEKRAICL